MFNSDFTNFNPEILYSIFPKKKLKISKKGLKFISNKNTINNNLKNHNAFNINSINLATEKGFGKQHKNFEITNYKWNYNENSNKPRFNAFASTGKNFYRRAEGKEVKSSYGRKYYKNNGYNLNKNNLKNDFKMNYRNNIHERVKSVHRTSLEKRNLNDKFIERFINQYETKVKKVLYEMGIVGDIKEKNNKPSNSQNPNFKTKSIGSERNYSNLPFLGNQNHEQNKHNLQKFKKINGYSNLNSCSETNIININNFINVFSDANSNTFTYNSNNIARNNHFNNNGNNNLYDSGANTTINNNLASNSTNSNIGNNNIIFGNSNSNLVKKNSFGNFNCNSKNLKIKNRISNSINSAFVSSTENKKLIPANSTAVIRNNILNPELKPINDNKNIQEIFSKKVRTISTPPYEQKINNIKEKKEDNENMNIITKFNNTNTLSKYNQAISSSSLSSNQIKKDKLSKYEIGHTLGKGAYAIVKIVTNILTQEKFAMKIYEKEKLSDNSKKKCVYREIEILKRINHKNIAKLIEVINTSKQILIIQELVNGISLRDYYNREIRNQKGISEHKAMIFKKIFKQIFDAMNYLHKNHMAHRDIKLENILMTREYEIKIIDFGFGMYNPENKLQNFYCGSPNYMPPEIAFKKPYIGQKADLWSLGVLVYKMYCADFPFKGKNEKDLYISIRKGKFTMASYIPDYIRKIIINMIELDPNKRLSCENVLNSSWLKD